VTARKMIRFFWGIEFQANANFIKYVPPLSPFRFLVTQKTNFSVVFTLHRTLITQLPTNLMELLRDCLLALPNLHMLVIMDGNPTEFVDMRFVWRNTDYNLVYEKVKTVFMKEPNFPNIKKAAIPIYAGPILSRLPNLEELACYGGCVDYSSVRYIPRDLHYVKKINGVVEPVLKSLSIIGPRSHQDFIGRT